MSNRIGMICKLNQQERKEIFTIEKVSIDDLDDMSLTMLEAFKGTVDYNGETLEVLREELYSVMKSTFGTFIPEASFKIKQNEDIAAVILISFYNEKPFVSELFTAKEYLQRGMASNLLKKSINSLLDLGYKDIVLYVHPKNEGAVNLYKKIGFIELTGA